MRRLIFIYFIFKNIQLQEGEEKKEDQEDNARHSVENKQQD